MIVMDQKIYYFSFINEDFFYRYHKDELIITRLKDQREQKYYLFHPQQIKVKIQSENVSILSITLHGYKSIFVFKHNSMKLRQIYNQDPGKVIGNQKYLTLNSNHHSYLYSNFRMIRKIRNENLEKYDQSLYLQSPYCRPMLSLLKISTYKRNGELQIMLKEKIMNFFKNKNKIYYQFGSAQISFLNQFILLRPKHNPNKVDKNLYVDVGFIQFNEKFYGEIVSEKDFTLMNITYYNDTLYALFNNQKLWKVEKIYRNERHSILQFTSENAMLYKQLIVYFTQNEAIIQNLNTMTIRKIEISPVQQ